MELKRLLTRATALLLQGAYQGAESFIEQAMAEADKLKQYLAELDTLRNRILEMAAEIERLNSAWQVETLNRKDSIIAKQEEEKDRLKSENAHLQSVIDEANAQEPVIRVLDGRVADFNPNYDGDVSNGEFFARPIPAQQSPAVAVHENAVEAKENLENFLHQNTNWHPREWAEIQGFIDGLVKSKSPRITEQDAREIIDDYIGFCDGKRLKPQSSTVIGMYMKNEFSALLEKLNGDHNGK